MILPDGDFSLLGDEELEEIDVASLPTKTYKLDFENGRCGRMIEGIEAMEQAIYKMLNTDRFAHAIYSDDYGFENMIGYEELFIRGELPRRIEEALLQDERITSVEDMDLSFEGDTAFVRFTCVTIYGDVNVLKEVSTIV